MTGTRTRDLSDHDIGPRRRLRSAGKRSRPNLQSGGPCRTGAAGPSAAPRPWPTAVDQLVDQAVEIGVAVVRKCRHSGQSLGAFTGTPREKGPRGPEPNTGVPNLPIAYASRRGWLSYRFCSAKPIRSGEETSVAFRSAKERSFFAERKATMRQLLMCRSWRVGGYSSRPSCRFRPVPRQVTT